MYGNYRNAAKYGGHILANAEADILDRAIEFPATQAKGVVGLWMSPIRVVE